MDRERIRRILGIIIALLVLAIIGTVIWILAVDERRPAEEAPPTGVEQPEPEVSIPEGEIREEAPEEQPPTEGKKEEPPRYNEGGQPPIQSQLKMQTITLSPIMGFGGSGVATRTYNGSTFSLEAQANVPDPRQDDIFAAWLAKRVGEKGSARQFLSMGKLEKKDGVFRGQFSRNENLLDYQYIIVSVEPGDQPLLDLPRAPLLEEVFK